MVKIPDFHSDDPGSIPGIGKDSIVPSGRGAWLLTL